MKDFRIIYQEDIELTEDELNELAEEYEFPSENGVVGGQDAND